LAWNKSQPTSATKVKDADDYIRGDWVAFNDALGREHQNMSNASSGEHKPGRVSAVKIDTAATISAMSSLDGAIGFATDIWDFIINDGSTWQRARQIESGTVCFFFQDTAPSGWTVVSSMHDRLILIDSAAGATSGGTWTFSGYTTDGHQHVYTGIPSHNHSFTCWDRGGVAVYDVLYDGGTVLPETFYTDYTGDASPTTDAISSDVISGDGNWRPAGCNFILCSKD